MCVSELKKKPSSSRKEPDPVPPLVLFCPVLAWIEA